MPDDGGPCPGGAGGRRGHRGGRRRQRGRPAGAREAPDVVDHVVRVVAREEGRERVLLLRRRHEDRVRDHERRHALLERGHVVHGDAELHEDRVR